MNQDFVIRALKNIIGISLGGPRGDPDFCNITAAAQAYAALEHMGYDVDADIEVFINDNGIEYMEKARKGKTY